MASFLVMALPGGLIAALTAPAAPVRAAAPVVRRPEDDTDKPRKETEEQRRNRERTNRASEDEYRIEGNVVAVACDGPTPTVTIANRDGRVAVQLIKGAEKHCSSVRVGDYLTGEGYKEHEALFIASEISTERR
jgi:hypothetical protein